MDIGTAQAQAVVQIAFASLGKQRDVSAIQAVDVVVGGQYGSEAKGHVTQQVIQRRVRETDRNNPVLNIRVAGPNAGHTVYARPKVNVTALDDAEPDFIDGELQPFAFRQLPVGIVEDADRVFCAIAPGSEIDLPVLLAEIEVVRNAGLWPKQRFLLVDPEATLLRPEHKLMEEALVSDIGSTGKGIGAARSSRIMRSAQRLGDNPAAVQALTDAGAIVRPVALLYAVPADQSGYNVKYQVVIEGTQGFGLGLHAGMYPQCTSSDCRAVDFLGMAGISPWELDYSGSFRKDESLFKVWVVFRPFPIRVAGNSGPLHGERTWEALGLPEERTTVTKKVRRVGTWDPELAKAAVRANGGGFRHTRHQVVLALTMADQLAPGVAGATQVATLVENATIDDFIDQIQAQTGAVVDLVTTSPHTAVWLP